jgi:hypothetical protein
MSWGSGYGDDQVVLFFIHAEDELFYSWVTARLVCLPAFGGRCHFTR